MRALGVALLAISLTTILFAGIAQEASADHVYTHRYIIQGRVVDDAGDPVSQARVTVDLPGWFPRDEGLSGTCRQGGAQAASQDGRSWVTATNQIGDYRVCLHAHQLQPAGSVEVTVGNTTEDAEKDIDVRMNVVDLVIPEGSAGQKGDLATFAGTFGVRGRMWQPLSSDDRIEGIPATGVAPVNKQFTAILTLQNGTELSQEGQTNQYGEFALRFDTDADLTGATLTLETIISGETVTETMDADARDRMNDVRWVIQQELDTNGAPGFALPALLVAVGVSLALAARVRRG